MQNNIPNISFKSNIRFITNSQYEKLSHIVGTDIVREMWKSSQVVDVQSQGATKNTLYCLAGVIRDLNTKTNNIFHWCPDEMFTRLGRREHNLSDIGEKLNQMASEAKTKGFLVGGLSKDCDKNKSELSLKLLNFFKRHFNADEREDFTMFFGQRNNFDGRFWPKSAFVYSLKDDTYYVNSQIYVPSKDDWRDVLSKEEIKNHFDWIHVAKEDKVFLGLKTNVPVENDFWNKSKLHQKVNILC